ncbi:acetaldehyde dehydrogenase (acetylating) [Sulfurimonas sp.]|uniref:acetaldehyde dehydrogenase (acetylating) n=1 Tax=Sulfurimonas sp. TaxID=2022749 RepID=UPI002B483F06|nr:acetaldehyde dehydrogenase (acetylating) [Sulfurimonas sp.]
MKINCALIGSGNIGTDLMFKLQRSEILNPLWMVGIDPKSDGLLRAKKDGMKITSDGVDGLLPYIKEDGIKIAFDATSAYVHGENNRKLAELGVKVIDLTPAAIGPFCVPSVNMVELLAKDTQNVNMVTCGGQATIPMVAAISSVQEVEYAEIVATISSKSAGPGTRMNIDEFTKTTKLGITEVGGAKTGKAIVILNPAEPPLMMRDTIHCLTKDTPDQEAIIKSVNDMVATMKKVTPGYELKNGPVFDGNKVSMFLEVTGLGDYLPTYAGNLDIITAAATTIAEKMAEKIAVGE